MSEEKMDRRSRRTFETLLQALLQLMETRTYDQISVQDIVVHANIGRSTFYAHFANKDELLMQGFEAMLEHVTQQILLDEEGHLHFNAAPFFQHAAGHYELYRTLIWGTGLGLLVKDGQERFSCKVEERLAFVLKDKQDFPLPLDVFSHTLSGSLLVMLKWWLDHKLPYTAEMMDLYFQHMIMANITQTFS